MNLKYEVGQKVPVIHSTPVSGMEEIKSITVGPKGAKYSTLSGAYTEAELDAFAKSADKPKHKIEHKWNIGDSVVIQDSGKGFPTYEEWFRQNGVGELENLYTACLKNHMVVKILAIGRHERGGYGTLYAVETESGKVGLISEDGLCNKPAPSFDWDAFKAGKIAVHCDTEEKAKAFVQKCRENLPPEATDLWEKGETNWNAYSEDTCYVSDISDGMLCYSPKSYFRRKGYTIIDYPFSEQPEAEKEPEPEFYSGKVVCVAANESVLEAGKVYSVIDGRLMRGNSYHPYNRDPQKTLADLNKIAAPHAKFIEFKGEQEGN